MLIKNDNDQTEWKWALLLLCSIMNGLFYQPLGILINSAIIKILGDFRVLFYGKNNEIISVQIKKGKRKLAFNNICMKTGSYLRWGDATRVVVIGLIGLVARKSNEDSFGTMLLGVWIVGAILLCVFALSKSNAVVPANLDQLNIRDDQAPLLLKSALRLTVDQSSIYYAVYKPYSIFGEQLSHISEEDASLLDRVMTTEDSLRQMYSYVSNVPSFYSRRITTNDGLVQYRSQNTEQGEAYEEEEHRTFHAYALALLPLPTSTDPLVALLSNPEDEEAEEELFPRTSYYYQPQNNPHLMKLKNWKLKALSVTILLVGITKALLNTFLFIYSSSVLGISVTDIACLIMVQLTSEAMVHFTIEKVSFAFINVHSFYEFSGLSTS
ncbi:hypothetical protein G6F56_005284 [Rhizopus delemar]|nr:hypothetical protein G6F56_005284 [Rhizopus delemar]